MNARKTIDEGLNKIPPPTFAQVLMNNPKKVSQEREGVLLLKPKLHKNNDYEKKKSTILNELRTKDPSVRVRNVSPIHGGGVKIVTASVRDAEIIKEILVADNQVDNLYELIVPGPRSPQVILYNIEGDIEEEQLRTGLLEKNLFPGDGNNEPVFKVDFSIPGKRSNNKHWVISLPPNTFHEIKNKGGLYFGWHRVRTSEFISLKQCKNCLGFGHTTKYCDRKDETRCEGCGDIKVTGETHK
ncbi:hypothetical protein HNY73_009554 [Argiope bruennichi]|uniref:Gag-like protein n=1 Tax=Argiope bruennichi TaxID=94029 RepID=A0A8T0F9V3_ARGBR|nr:hypothetical protein HNY73_009554 [Argiope bruennichi]